MDSHSEIKDLPFLTPHPRYARDRRLVPTRRGFVRDSSGQCTPALERRHRTERRASPRLECEMELEERVNGWRFFRISWDLSTFGISTRHGSPYAPGTRVRLRLLLPDEQPPLELVAEVLGVRSAEGGQRMAFRSPPLDAVKRIHRYVTQQSPRRPSTRPD